MKERVERVINELKAGGQSTDAAVADFIERTWTEAREFEKGDGELIEIALREMELTSRAVRVLLTDTWGLVRDYILHGDGMDERLYGSIRKELSRRGVTDEDLDLLRDKVIAEIHDRFLEDPPC